MLPKNQSDLTPLPPSPSRGGGNLPLSPPSLVGKGAGGLGLLNKLRCSRFKRLKNLGGLRFILQSCWF